VNHQRWASGHTRLLLRKRERWEQSEGAWYARFGLEPPKGRARPLTATISGPIKGERFVPTQPGRPARTEGPFAAVGTFAVTPPKHPATLDHGSFFLSFANPRKRHTLASCPHIARRRCGAAALSVSVRQRKEAPVTPTSQSPSILGPSSQAKAPEGGTAVVPARLMTRQPRERAIRHRKGSGFQLSPTERAAPGSDSWRVSRKSGLEVDASASAAFLAPAQAGMRGAAWRADRREGSLQKIRRKVRPSQRPRRLDQAAEHDEGRNRFACSSNEA
jgi:hypothetical protein